MKQLDYEIAIRRYTGTHFEVGQQLGQQVREKYGPDYINKTLVAIKDVPLYKALGMDFELSPTYVDKVFPIVEGIIQIIHPDLLTEMRGFAQGLGEDYQRWVVFTSNFGNDRGCSQFFVNGYHAHNYDDALTSVENEFLLLSPSGSYTSFGAGTGFIERLDGINDRGLVASLTFAAGHPPVKYGIGSAMFVRIILDKASNVNEALEIFNKSPYVTPNNVLISDSSGKAIVIEVSGEQHRVRKSGNGIIICANSYMHPEMKGQQKFKNPTTQWREEKMQTQLEGLTDQRAIMDFLTADFPVGLYEPYYTEALGTLWSVIYHPETGDIYLAIGEASKRKEIRFNLANPETFNKLPITLKTQITNMGLGERIAQYQSKP